MDVAAFRAAHDAITARSDVIVQFTSGGAVGDDETSRAAPLELRPEMATLNAGSVNFGDDVFLNPSPLVRRLYSRMLELGILPEYEIFDAGMIAGAQRHFEALGASHHQHFDLVLGVPGGMPAWPNSIEFLTGHLPEGATWSATGIGKAHLHVAIQAIERGGHVRTGLEDVRYYEPGRLADSNRQLISRVAGLASKHERSVATPRQAREILGLQERGA
jgi:3-keto-5-aminohexanoate cleavage enzyme